MEDLEKKKKRDMNFEFLRIISMILIVSSHYMLHSGIIDEVHTYSFNFYFVEFIRTITRVSVNLYILITGYYMVKSKMKIKKILNLYSIVLFYSIFMLILSVLSRRTPSIKEIISSLFPISSGLYWFATIYMALYLLSPFINKLILILSKNQYRIMIIILTIFIIFQKLIFTNNSYIEARNGESIVWFIYLYLFAGYIRLHYNNENFNKKLCILSLLTIPFIIIGIRTLSLIYLEKELKRLLYFNNIFIFIETLCIFLLVKELKIPQKGGYKVLNVIIEKIAPLTFGIYLIHDNQYFKPFLWKEILKVNNFSNSPYLVLHFIISVILVFTVCSIIEYIRLKMFEKLKNTKKSKAIDEKMTKLDEKFAKMME